MLEPSFSDKMSIFIFLIYAKSNLPYLSTRYIYTDMKKEVTGIKKKAAYYLEPPMG